MIEQIVFREKISIRPNRVTTTIEKEIQVKNALGFYEAKPKIKFANSAVLSSDQQQTKPILEKKFHNFNISVNSQRNLRDKISYLFQFSKQRKIKTFSGNIINGFKVCFLTLTLPAKQKHPTALITQICLDDFLQKCRKWLGMKNYVWRLEFQSNGNVHYHLVTDTYIDFFWSQKEWNKSVELLGYVSDYARKMHALSYTDYLQNFNNNISVSNEILYKRYVKGRASGWQNPNSTDVKSAKSSDNIGFYISKYFSKKEKTAKCNELDNEINSFALRLCFWSRSLSRLKIEVMPLDYFMVDFRKWLRVEEGARELVFDYARVIYFDFNKLGQSMKYFFGKYFRSIMEHFQYLPAS